MVIIGVSMQLLCLGFVGCVYCYIGSFIYQVVKGYGYFIIDGQCFDWKECDIFCVLFWVWYEYVNGSVSEDVCLFCFSDLLVMEKLGLYCEEVYVENQGY